MSRRRVHEARLQRVVGVGGHGLRLRYAQVVAPKDKPYRVYKAAGPKGLSGRTLRVSKTRSRRSPSGTAALHHAPRGTSPLSSSPGPSNRSRCESCLHRRGPAGRDEGPHDASPSGRGSWFSWPWSSSPGWGAFGYFAFRGGVKEANARLPEDVEASLAPLDGSLLSTPANILLLGVDTGGARGDETGRADAIVLVRTDPDSHRISLLSIPRDLRVEIPGHGPDKINAAYAFGGPALAVDTVRSVTGLPIHHVAVVDFSSFADVIDELGGISIDVPKPIVSNRFDCPFKSRADCVRWKGWRFAKGPQEMDGRRALVYSRIRENQLDPSESDITRGGRQQQVVQAMSDEIVSFNGFLRLPFIGDDVVRPLATDLTATELLELGWV